MKLACMGGAYGNVAALRACLDDALAQDCDTIAFLGDAIGCCGHSRDTLRLIHAQCDVLVAGNHEQQAASGAAACGCGYASSDDERIACLAFALATEVLTDADRHWLATWPSQRILDLAGHRVLLCHGSPDQTNEFLWDSQLDSERLARWFEQYNVNALVCTHTGIPWIRTLDDNRLAVNCGVVGKPDHDGDPAVHYALLDLAAGSGPRAQIRRVSYDYEAFARRMEAHSIDPVFVKPLRTGWWTTGHRSLPPEEAHRSRRDPNRHAR